MPLRRAAVPIPAVTKTSSRHGCRMRPTPQSGSPTAREWDMFEEDAGLLADFVVEANEGLAEIESDLLAIEERGADIDVDRVNKVFRAIHSIKGAAGFLALEAIGALSHSMENVLSLVRSRSLV